MYGSWAKIDLTYQGRKPELLYYSLLGFFTLFNLGLY